MKDDMNKDEQPVQPATEEEVQERREELEDYAEFAKRVVALSADVFQVLMKDAGRVVKEEDYKFNPCLVQLVAAGIVRNALEGRFRWEQEQQGNTDIDADVEAAMHTAQLLGMHVQADYDARKKQRDEEGT